ASINASAAGLASAQRRLASVQAEYQARLHDLASVNASLIRSRLRLLRLENRLQDATKALARNLVAAYESDRPDIVTVVLGSRGFSDVLERFDFLKRMQHADTEIVGDTRTARAEVAREATALGALETRDRKLAKVVSAKRTEAAAIESALMRRQ